MSESSEEDSDEPNLLNIKITRPRFKTWTRDVNSIDFEQDLLLFQQKVMPNNPKITHVGIYQGFGDHVELFARTADGDWVKMDMGVFGSRVIFPADQPTTHIIENGTGTPIEGLSLHELFRQFYLVARTRPFNFVDYNCQRFAFALLGKLVVPDDNDPFW